jgi:sialic acid synthase
VLGPADVAMKSPGDGLPPYYLEQVLGRTLLAPLEADENITLERLSQGEAG